MLTARRMRERQVEEAAGLPPPAPPRRQDIPWYEHEAALSNLENRLRAELVEAKAETFTLSLDSAEFQAAIKPMVEEFEAKAKQVVERNEQLEKLFEEAASEISKLQAEKAELSAKADAVAKELLEWQAAADLPAAKAELAAEAAPAPEAAAVAPTATPAATPAENPKKGAKPKPR